MSAPFPEALRPYGWDERRQEEFAPLAAEGAFPARVIAEYSGEYRVVTAGGEGPAKPAGKLKHRAQSRAELPAVGDWVALTQPDTPGELAMVQAVLPRRSKFSRGAAGDRDEEQVVAANVDYVWIVASADVPLNPRRLERFLAVSLESGAAPVFVLTKIDKTADVAAVCAEALAVAKDAPVHAVSNKTGQGLDALRTYLSGGRTVALLGPSGVGKTSLLNALVGSDIAAVREVRESDARGRHTTTNRQLIRLPGDGLVIDTPGIRELQLWDADEGLDEAFDDVAELALQCKFTDCRHAGEPGCAVRHAVEQGTAAPKRVAAYLKLQAELARQVRGNDPVAREANRKRIAGLVKQYRKKPRK